MKKLLSLLLTMLMIFSLVGCNTKKENELVVKEQTVEKVIQEETKQEEDIEEEIIVEEPKEEVKTISQDITNMYFWVVFYDQYGNELQREALKYGTIPEYKGWLPEGFEKWDKSLKAIKGNTYYHAICHKVSHTSGGSSGSNPNPSPQINEYGFYYNAKYYGPILNANIIFTDTESSPGSKIAFLDIQSPLITIATTFPYTVNGNIISLSFGVSGISTIDFTIDDENSLSTSIVAPAPYGTLTDSFTITQHNIQSGIVDSYFFYMDSTLLSTVGLDSATSITIPSGFQTIGDYFLSQNTSIQSVTIPSSVRYINSNAFADCENLSTVNLPNGLLIIGNKAFSTTAITSISIPSTVTTIDSFAFGDCYSLNNCFFETNSSVTYIGNYAFTYSALTSLVLPDHLITIDENAFFNCNVLESITIPETVATLAKACFHGCNSLTTINFLGTVDQWNNIDKGELWNAQVPATEVICSNGTVSLSSD